jgi:SAM-dependent methyltransferase
MKQSDLPKYNIEPYDKFFNLDRNEKMWKVFFDFFDRSYKILDFGCGAAFSVYFGRKLGYDIVGVDTKNSGNAERFIEFRDALGVSDHVKLYDGFGRLPYEDNSFSLIVCRASFNKFNRSVGEKKENIPLVIERLNEFDRILDKSRIVVITGSYFKKQFQEFDFKVYNWSKYEVTRLWKN